MNWLLIIPPLIEGVLLIIVGAGWIHAEMRDHSAYWKMETELAETCKQNDKLNTENANLHAQLADRNEALQEAMAENKALQMQMIEVQEVAPAPMTYAEAKPSIEKAAATSPAKRTTRKKAETQ